MASAIFAGCGGSHASGGGRSGGGATRAGGPGTAAFSWLRPGTAPASWPHRSIQGGHATIAYPPEWTQISGDAGTATAVLHSGSVFHAYVNITPRQDGEQTHGWAAFRLNFERHEGGTNVAGVAAAENLSFTGGHGSCVIDDYTARVSPHARYREIACFVAGPHASTVVIAAAPVSEWVQRSAQLEQVVSSFRES